MKKVKIISGHYGHRNGTHIEVKDRKSEPFMLDDEQAKHLVEIGVAEIVSSVAVATGAEGDGANETSKDPPEIENGQSDENDGMQTLDEGQLAKMKNEDLKKLGEDMGIDTAGLRTKQDLIAAITAVEIRVSDDGDDGPPELAPEAPVV